MTIWDKFFNQEPQKYYDAGTNINSAKAQAMVTNEGNKYIATRKNDGEWCRIIKGEDGRIVAQSRSISKVTGEYGDKTAHIPHIIQEFDALPFGTVLLGELCFNDDKSTSREVGTILRCLPPKAIARQKGRQLYFKVFDCLAIDMEDISDWTFENRFNKVEWWIKEVLKDKLHYIQLCDYVEDNFTDFLADILKRGGEGIVIHSKAYKYAPGKRTAWETLKVKKTTGEIECPVIGLIEPKMLYEGTERNSWKYWEGWYKDNPTDTYLAYDPCADDFYNTTMEWVPVTKPYFNGWKNGVKVYHNGNIVNVTSGLTDDDREWLASREGLDALTDGRLVAVISGMEITESSIRHPRLVRLRTEA